MMKKSIAVLLAALTLAQFTACGGSDEPAETTAATTAAETALATPGTDALTDDDKAAYSALIAQNAERAAKIGTTIEKYYISGRGTSLSVAEKVNVSTKQKINANASVWHFSSVLSMVSKLQAIDANGQAAAYDELYDNLLESMDYYKGTAYITDYTGTHKQTMYAVNRASSKGRASLADVAAVYDDQMWLIREMVYAYKLTGEEKYMELGLSLTEACLAGWDSTLNSKGEEYGGICWGPGYQTKHTCSNAPIIEPLVEIYEIFTAEGRENADYYLDWAKKIYKWTTRLMTSGGVYGDLLGSERKLEGSGKAQKYVTVSQSTDIDKTAYTYNTGAMISGGAALYRVTGENAYLRQAKRSAKAAHQTLGNLNVEDDCVLYPTNTSTCWFDLILLEGYIDLFPYDENCKEYIDCMQNSLDYAYDNHMTDDGFMPRNLLTGWIKTSSADTEKNVMDQASVAEMYAILSEFYTSLTKE